MQVREQESVRVSVVSFARQAASETERSLRTDKTPCCCLSKQEKRTGSEQEGGRGCELRARIALLEHHRVVVWKKE